MSFNLVLNNETNNKQEEICISASIIDIPYDVIIERPDIRPKV